ncbi:AAA family ATPase [Streptomyces decoyicus]|uniref:AAA family ATPase n=1 Tax=Streptomyces decoyicus TaxID=249567 RepID=UPI00069DB0A3|nr:AAA family ATPase [Streptomyces decoyicus]KOG39386.1 ATPase AAA [Streptomyces decoyicus]QZY18166.1 ATP-binding protein [Streptomyces decoyicus]
MDPNPHRGPEEYGEQGRPAEPPAPAFGGARGGSGGLARVVRLVSGAYLVTVNPVDGSEIEPCPPGERPEAPGRLDPQERAAAARAAAPPLPPGPPGFAGHQAPLEERTEDTERLVRLLSRGRSVRVTGPSGSGRTRLLDAVAAGCADLAPDGVIRLSGYHRTATDLLYELFAAVYRAPQHRPDRPELLRMIAEIGAIVVLDDLEFGGAALDELLDATPECAFLIAATPDVAAPSADSHLEEVFLGGLGRDACARLLARAVDRPLTDDEEAWAADLWFESEGLPLRFVQAAALLRRYDRMRAGPGALDDGYGLFPEAGTTAFPGTAAFPEEGTAPDPADTDVEPGEDPEVLLPSLGEAAAPAPLLAARLGAAAQETLRIAVALGGELPHQAHLPALTQDTHADAALGELLACGLITPVGSHYRLAATVQDQLEAAGYAEGAAARAHTAAQHYAWWAGHPSVTPERAAAESDVALAAMGVLTGSRESGHASAAVLLARTAAPAFAAALQWSAWERSLRHGQEAARLAGEVAEEAYFHHELGVLALCTGSLDRARAELEASIGLRGVLSDRNGAVAGRRALALVTDRSRADAAAAATTALPQAAAQRGASKGRAGTPRDGVSTAKLRVPRAEETAATIVARGASATAATTSVPAAAADGTKTGKGALRVFGGARRNAVAAGAGALLAAVLGTIVTLGATGGDQPHDDKVSTEQTTDDSDSTDLPAEQPGTGSGLPPTAAGTTRPGTPGHAQTPSPSVSDPATSGSPTESSAAPTDPTTAPTDPTGRPTTPTGRPTHTRPPTDEPTDPTPTDPTDEPTDPTPTEGPTDKPTTQSPSQSAANPSGGSSSGSGTTPSDGGTATGGTPSDGTPSDGTAPSSGTQSAPAG